MSNNIRIDIPSPIGHPGNNESQDQSQSADQQVDSPSVKKDIEDEKYSEFLEEYKLRELIKRYSDCGVLLLQVEL